jgi:iron complex transport system ATP-binding protein
LNAIECIDASCGYSNKPVLQALNLVVRPGECVALLGPNGSGKSTLLKALSKTLPLTEGTIKVMGQEIDSLSYLDLARQVAFVPQEEVQHFPFKVRDVVTLGRLPQSPGLRDTPEDRLAATEAMETADCLELADRTITELSGGEKQRVLIARALAQDAPILLLDEPTAHLDISHQLAIAGIIGGLAAAGKTALVAAHDLNLASSFATRAILLTTGRVVLDAPIADVLDSKMLDDVYGTRFERVSLPSGRTVIFAL